MNPSLKTDVTDSAIPQLDVVSTTEVMDPALEQTPDRDALWENFCDELDIWARQAMSRNGFGDC